MPDGTGPVTTVRVHYPSARCTNLGLRGAAGNLNWTTDAPTVHDESAKTYTYSTRAIAAGSAATEIKPLCDGTWAIGPNYSVATGDTVDIYPHFFTNAGRVEKKWPTFTSTALPSTRAVFVYLPPTYIENDTYVADVFYMHDAQNLFDPATSYGGVEWGVDETMNAGAAGGTIREVLIVGIENTPDRIAELTPTPGTLSGGKADQYLAMVVNEIKPMVDGALRTNPSREHTGMMGSSLGGLITIHAAVKNGATFGIMGAMSPSSWWDNQEIVGEVNGGWTAAGAQKPLRLYLDNGQNGDSSADTSQVVAALRTKGYVDGATLSYVTDPAGQHNEASWARRLPASLTFLLGSGR